MRHLEQDHFTLLVNCVYSQSDKGASVNINTLDNAPQSGYMVGKQSIAVYDNLSSVNPIELKQRLIEFNQTNDSNALYFGVWRDKETGKVHFDISEWVEYMNTAIKTGYERDQIAIWSLDDDCEIRL